MSNPHLFRWRYDVLVTFDKEFDFPLQESKFKETGVITPEEVSEYSFKI